MSSEQIIKRLKILGINSYSQLKENQIIYWWEKKYIEIQESDKNTTVKSELIIELIEAKEYLEGIDKEIIKQTINNFFKDLTSSKNDGAHNKVKLIIISIFLIPIIGSFIQVIRDIDFKPYEYERSSVNKDIVTKRRNERNNKIEAWHFYNDKGVKNFYKGEYEKAIEDFSHAIALNTIENNRYSQTFRLRGESYFYLKNYCNSLYDFKKAIAINNNLPSIRNLLSVAQKKCKKN